MVSEALDPAMVKVENFWFQGQNIDPLRFCQVALSRLFLLAAILKGDPRVPSSCLKLFLSTARDHIPFRVLETEGNPEAHLFFGPPTDK